MARNNSNPWKLAAILLTVFSILGISGLGVYFLMNRSNPLSKLPPFPVDSYLGGGNLWSDEAYRLEGRIDNVLARTPERTALLVSVHPEGSEKRLPVIVRTDEKKKPVQREQQLILKVVLGDSQQLVCTDYVSK